MPFSTRMTVRFADIDPAGVVYYPRFLHYCHVAMEEFFARELELPYARLFAEHRIGFPAVHLEVDFRRPLRYGDEVEIEVAVAKLGRTSVDWRYTMRRAGEADALAEVKVVTACLDVDKFRARTLPEWLLALFASRIPAGA